VFEGKATLDCRGLALTRHAWRQAMAGHGHVALNLGLYDAHGPVPCGVPMVAVAKSKRSRTFDRAG